MQPTDLTSYFSSPQLNQAQTDYNTAQGQATQEQATADTLPTLLKSALAAKFGEDNPLVKQRGDQTTAYLNSIASSQNDVLPENNHGIVLSPIQQAMMMNSKQNAYLQPLATTNYLLGNQSGGIQNIIDSAVAAQKARSDTAQGRAGLARQNYHDLLDTLSKQADVALQQRSQGLQQQRFSFDLQGGLKGIRSQELVQDAQKGITLQDALNKYKGQLTPDEIFSTYNSSSKYGTAKESPAQLLKYGIKPPYTQDELTRIDALKPAQAAINSLSQEMINLAGPQNKGWNQFSINNLGGLGVNQKIVGANQTFQLMKQNVVRALQGARMSDQDIKMAKQYIPEITDTSDTVKTKLSNLQVFINSVNPQNTSSANSQSRPPLSSFNK